MSSSWQSLPHELRGLILEYITCEVTQLYSLSFILQIEDGRRVMHKMNPLIPHWHMHPDLITARDVQTYIKSCDFLNQWNAKEYHLCQAYTQSIAKDLLSVQRWRQVKKHIPIMDHKLAINRRIDDLLTRSEEDKAEMKLAWENKKYFDQLRALLKKRSLHHSSM